ncbi:MAG: glycosyltransferase family 4 protein [Ramlibacter sp.]|nr:glycosyltransferase family 4 protein [Ramlibacter sp.]
MKIVMLCNFFNEALTYQENMLARFYVKHGHAVTVLASTFENLFDFVSDRYDPSWPNRDYVADGIRIVKRAYRWNILNRVRIFPPISELLQEIQPDLIFVHDIHMNLPEATQYKLAHPGTRLVMDYHADYSNSAKNWLSLKVLHGVIRKSVLDRARPSLDRIYPVVPASANFLAEVYGVTPEEMTLLPLGVDMDMARRIRLSDARDRLRLQLGIPPEGIVIFTGGKLDPLKQTDALIEAFRQCQHPNLFLVVVGESPPGNKSYGVQLRQQAIDIPNIFFTGWVSAEQLLEHMAMSDFAVFPASQSVLWQQAISMGLPALIGDRTAVRKGAQDVSYLNLRENIHVIDGSQPLVPQIVSEINRLAGDPALRKAMSEGALYTADHLLDWDRIGELTLVDH